jgi:hypothetical protein
LYIVNCQPYIDKHKKHSNKLSREVFSHIGAEKKTIQQIVAKKYRSFKAKMLNSVLEVSDKNPSDES